MGKMPIPRVTVRYSGLFDFDGLYAAVIDWAKNQGYMWHEVDYKHKVPVPAGAEQQWKWQLTKEVNDYIHYMHFLTVHLWDLKEVAVEIEGKKKHLSSGRIYIWMDGRVTYDWQKRFQKGGRLMKMLGEFYAKSKDPELSEYWDALQYRNLALQAVIKKFFDMQGKKNVYAKYLKED